MFEYKTGKKTYIAKFGKETDEIVSRFWVLVKRFFSHLNIKNTVRLFTLLWKTAKELTWETKKRFDSTQPKFFIQQNQFDPKGKGRVSFFWRNVSDYKKGLKENNL